MNSTAFAILLGVVAFTSPLRANAAAMAPDSSRSRLMVLADSELLTDVRVRTVPVTGMK
jgi:hypothetical protein